jgi:signal transduction histidine kinase
VFCGEQQLKGVFDNLIQNAIDAMPNGGTLSIVGMSVERESNLWIEICVKDTGLGIVEADLEKIFELGFTTKSDQGSMGFGLWWTRSQVESLGGQLVVNSMINQGSQFTLILPAHTASSQRGESL